MASESFVRSVIVQMGTILHSERECSRLSLTQAIIHAWRGYLAGDRKKMVEIVIFTASLKGVALEHFEALENAELESGRFEAKSAKASAEAILIAVDSFYRETSGFPLPEGSEREEK